MEIENCIRERCKGVHCVDLGESFHMSIYLQNLASIQPRTSLVKFARSPCTDPTNEVDAHAAEWSLVRRCQALIFTDCLQVRSEKPGLFNALNIATMELGRPSIIEAPTECAHFTSRDGYLQAWGSWCALA